MSSLSGLELLRAIRFDNVLRDAKFTMMTTLSNVSAVVAPKRTGVDGYILKPFSPPPWPIRSLESAETR